MNAVEFVQDITAGISGYPTEVSFQKDDQGTVIDVKAEKGIPVIIGKEGRTLDAIRIIAIALGQDGNHRIRVRLNEHHEPTT